MASGLSNTGLLRKRPDFALMGLSNARPVAMDRDQSQFGRQTRFGEHLQRGALILQQSFRYPQYHTDNAVTASGAAGRAVVAIDDHGFF